MVKVCLRKVTHGGFVHFLVLILILFKELSATEIIKYRSNTCLKSGHK